MSNYLWRTLRVSAAGVVLWLSKLCMYIDMTGVVVSNYLWRTLGVSAAGVACSSLNLLANLTIRVVLIAMYCGGPYVRDSVS